MQVRWLEDGPPVEGIDKSPKLIDFDIKEVIGKGSYGKVVEVVSKGTGKKYALKIIEKSTVEANGLHGQVISEIGLHFSLKHPHIIQLYSYFEDHKLIYLLLELADRETLYAKLRSSKSLKEAETSKVYGL